MTQLALSFDVAPPRARRTAALRHFKPRDESPDEALAGEARARGQEVAILWHFRTQGRRLTPSDVHEAFPRWPLQSVRRALTNLSTAREGQEQPPLRKHPEDRRPGPRGARECTWGLA